MKIPITKHLTTEVTDLVGYLDISEDLADELAALFGNGLSVRMNACVAQYGDKFTLRHVSLTSVPVASKVRRITTKLTGGANERRHGRHRNH